MGKLGNVFALNALTWPLGKKSKQVECCCEQIKSILRTKPSCKKLQMYVEKTLWDIFYRYTVWNNNSIHVLLFIIIL